MIGSSNQSSINSESESMAVSDTPLKWASNWPKVNKNQKELKRLSLKLAYFSFLFYFQVENDIIGSETNPKLVFQSIRYEIKSATLFLFKPIWQSSKLSFEKFHKHILRGSAEILI